MGSGSGARPGSRENRQDLRQQLEMYRLIFDSIYNGCLVTDAEGYITHFNRPYGEFLGIDAAAQIGKHCTEVIENTRMHIVARTGVPEINHSQPIMGQDMVVQRIPIRKEGRVVAVFGQVMFKDIRHVRQLAEKLSVLQSKVEFYEKELLSLRSTRYTFDSIVGVSQTIQALKEEALQASANSLPVLITGESGTGKELFAQAIHQASERNLRPFVRINCAAIPKDLLESELFGYEKGAFTGARSEGKAGKFELAKGGTVFLDEIGDLPLQMQPKLLRVVEEKDFERVGGTALIHSDFRLIAATNQNLEEMVDQGRFRKDLYYRLNVIPLHIPPLRERREDIVALARHLLERIAQEAAIQTVELDAAAAAVLEQYDWRGNGRELANVLERVISSLKSPVITAQDLPFFLHRAPGPRPAGSGRTLRGAQSRAEREAIVSALVATGYNKARAAEMLGIHRTMLYKKMHRYGLPLRPVVPALKA